MEEGDGEKLDTTHFLKKKKKKRTNRPFRLSEHRLIDEKAFPPFS